MKKSINIYAYFAKNLGDDLMVETLISRFPKHRFYTERDIKNENLLKYPNFKNKEYYLNPENHRKWFRKSITSEYCIKKTKQIEDSCVCSVLIGGSVFVQRRDITDAQVDNRLKRNNSYLNHGPLFVIGANFGAYSTDYFRKSYETHFTKCAGISFRDKASYNMFSRLQNVQYAPDVVFGYKKFPKQTAKTNEVIISVVDITQKYGIEKYCEKYESFIARLCDYAINIGKTPVLMSFCKAEGDETAIERIVSKSNNKGLIKTCFYDGDIKKALQRIANAESVVGTRFHAVVLAMKLGKPFFAVSYDQKINNMLQDMNCNSYYNATETETLTPQFVFDNLTKIDITGYEERSQLHFSQLEKYLKEKKR